MKNIQTALAAITVDNGYANTLNVVERVLQQGQSMQPPMAYVAEGDDTVLDGGPLSGANGLTSRQLNVGIRLIVQQDTDIDARSASEVMNLLAADVQRKMQEDYQRGGIAVNTEEVSMDAVQYDEGVPALFLDIFYKIHYRHSRTDPTIAG